MADGNNQDVNNYLAFSGFYGPNPYSQFQNQALPLPAYAGAPTDAMGRPIAGTTLNTPAPAAATPPPAAAQPSPFAGVQIPQGQNTAVAEPRGGLTPQQWQELSPEQRGAASNAMGEYSSGLGMMPSGNNFVASSNNPSGANPQASTALALMNAGGGAFNQMANAPQASAPAAPSLSPGTIDFLQARSLLANPGPVTTPGATGPSPVPQSNVLSQFLANNRGGTGAGNYSNAGFFNTLNALKGAQPGAG